MTTIPDIELAEYAAEIVGAYVSHNSVAPRDLPGLLSKVHGTLATLGQAEPEKPVTGPLVPAVPVKKSVTDDYIVCLEDGKRFKSLKRHLGQLGLTPAEYRHKWDLPADYPMVAPAYAAKRSELAKTLGLGRKAEVVS